MGCLNTSLECRVHPSPLGTNTRSMRRARPSARRQPPGPRRASSSSLPSPPLAPPRLAASTRTSPAGAVCGPLDAGDARTAPAQPRPCARVPATNRPPAAILFFVVLIRPINAGDAHGVKLSGDIQASGPPRRTRTRVGRNC